MFLVAAIYSESEMYRPINSIDDSNQLQNGLDRLSKWSFNQHFEVQTYVSFSCLRNTTILIIVPYNI